MAPPRPSAAPRPAGPQTPASSPAVPGAAPVIPPAGVLSSAPPSTQPDDAMDEDKADHLLSGVSQRDGDDGQHGDGGVGGGDSEHGDGGVGDGGGEHGHPGDCEHATDDEAESDYYFSEGGARSSDNDNAPEDAVAPPGPAPPVGEAPEGVKSLVAAVRCWACCKKKTCRILVGADGALANRCVHCLRGKSLPCDRNLWVPDYNRGVLPGLRGEAWEALLARSGGVRFSPDVRLAQLSAAAVGPELYARIQAELARVRPAPPSSPAPVPASLAAGAGASAAPPSTPRKRRRGSFAPPGAGPVAADVSRSLRDEVGDALQAVGECVHAQARLALVTQRLGLTLAGVGVQDALGLFDWPGRLGRLTHQDFAVQYGGLQQRLERAADAAGYAVDGAGRFMVRDA